jgi:hypothetical protein
MHHAIQQQQNPHFAQQQPLYQVAAPYAAQQQQLPATFAAHQPHLFASQQEKR